MRAPGVILSTAALLWGSLQAPFFHIHPEELDHPATSVLVHFHIHEDHAAPGTPAIGAHTADDDAIDVGWNLIAPPDGGALPDLDVGEFVVVPSPAPASVAVPIPQRRSHDPPDLISKHPRSPPV